MTTKTLSGRTIAILATEGVEEVELTKPRAALDAAGARTVLVSPDRAPIVSFDHHDKSKSYDVDRTLADVSADEFDALVLPGGALNPDALRTEPSAVAFVKAFFDARKPVAAICHAPWLLIEADVVRGRRLTSWPSLRTDVENAGGTWVDERVVRDGLLTTSRKPDDLEAFGEAIVAAFAVTPAKL